MASLKREKLYEQIILETYSKMFEASEPRFDFMGYIHTTKNYRDNKTNKPIVTDVHLSLDDMHVSGLCIDIPYENHVLDKDIALSIMNEQIKKYKLNKSEQTRFKTQIYLGCSPKFKNE